MVSLIIVLSLLIPGIYPQCTIQTAQRYFRRSVYEFSTDLIQRVATETDNHFVASGLSPWTLLAAVSLGATDDTYDEIKDVLRLHPHNCFNNKFFEIVKEMSIYSEGVVFERSSTLFVDSRFPLNSEFRNRVQITQVCHVQPLQFENYADTARAINEYVSNTTRGLVDEIITPSDLESAYLVLVDALYFRGTWKTKFDAADTDQSVFFDERGDVLGDVNLMFVTANVNLVAIRQIEANVLELPYTNDRFAMLFILPDPDSSVTSVIEKLQTISLTSIFIQFKQERPQDVMIQIPRFKISSDLANLKELLTDMGLKTLFDSSQAKLENLSDYSLYISNFFQKANIEVNEEGSEASVVSAAELEGRSLGPQTQQFLANRPFVYMIVDKKTEMALFTGAYSRPSLY